MNTKFIDKNKRQKKNKNKKKLVKTRKTRKSIIIRKNYVVATYKITQKMEK